MKHTTKFSFFFLIFILFGFLIIPTALAGEIDDPIVSIDELRLSHGNFVDNTPYDGKNKIFEKHEVIYITHPNLTDRKKADHRVFEQYDKRTTIYDNLVKLQKRKLIEKFSRSNGKRGRPLVFWKITEGR